MKVTLKTLTPLHIGTGNTIPPMEYYKTSDKYLIVFNMEQCLNRIFEKHGDSGVSTYEQWVADYVNQTENVKSIPGKQENQQLSQLRQQFNLMRFCTARLNDRELAYELLQNSQYWLYRCKLLSLDLSNSLLRENIKTNGKPYIPGSSIKGAIRTALAAYVVKHLPEDQAQQLWNGNAGLETLVRKREAQEVGKLVEDYVFCFGKKSNQSGDGPSVSYHDAKQDLLRFLHVTDALPVEYQLQVGEMGSCTFKHDRKSGKYVFNSTPIDLAEVIGANSTFSFQLQFDPRFPQIISKLLSDNQYVEIREKVRRLFGFDPTSKIDFEACVKTRLRDALREFAELVIAHDLLWLEGISIEPAPEIGQFYQRLTPQANLLHLGFAAGWHSTTICLALQANPFFARQQTVQAIIKQFNLDLTPKDKKLFKKDQSKLDQKSLALLAVLQGRSIRPDQFPASRRLIASYLYSQPDTPLGWCQLLLP